MSFSSILYNLLFPAFRTVSAPFRASLLFFCRPPTFSADMHVLGAPPLLDGDTYGFDGHECAYVLVKQGKVLLSFLLPACAEYRPPFFPLLKLCKRSRTAPSRSYPAPLAYFSRPSPPIRAVISSMRSSGKGGSHRGFRAILISFMGLSSAATLLELSAPHRRQR